MNSNNAKWIQGDGGPSVVLQESAALRWEGARDFENSLMQGRNVETDYDVICRCDDGISVISRHGRDMLVLSDSESPACFVPAGVGEVAVLQWFGSDRTLDELVRRLIAAPPSETLDFTVSDRRLRLLVGADDGNGAIYGLSESQVQPGRKTWVVYYSHEAQLAVLRPRP